MKEIIAAIAVAVTAIASIREEARAHRRRASRLRFEARRLRMEAWRLREEALGALERPCWSGPAARAATEEYVRLREEAAVASEAASSLAAAASVEDRCRQDLLADREKVGAELSAELWDLHQRAPGLGLRLNGELVEAEWTHRGRSAAVLASLAKASVLYRGRDDIKIHDGPAWIESGAGVDFGSGWASHGARRSPGITRGERRGSESSNAFVTVYEREFDGGGASGVVVETYDYEPGPSGRVLHVW